MSQVRCLMGQGWLGPNEGMPGNYWWDDDQNYGVLYIRSWMHQKETDSYLSGAFVILDWYKSRGATDSFRILQGDTIRQGTEKDAEEIVATREWLLEHQHRERTLKIGKATVKMRNTLELV